MAAQHEDLEVERRSDRTALHLARFDHRRMWCHQLVAESVVLLHAALLAGSDRVLQAAQENSDVERPVLPS
jgi:hypothetical protein